MLKKISKILLVVILVGASFFVFPPQFSSVSATDTTFEVNVKEVLSVSITTPSTWASGDINQFLRNTVSIDVTSNNALGFTAGMTTDSDSTALTNTSLSSATIPTLTSTSTCADATCAAFPANYWGFSLNDGANTGTYQALKNVNAAPDTILSSATATTGHKDIYFGAKANISQASGTYSSTVIISVVSGTSGADLPAPSSGDPDPVGPGENENQAQYDQTADATVYTYTTGNTTTTQVSEGNNVDAYTGYTPPQGVTNVESSNIYNGSLLTTMLATTASIAAGSGIFFFILAKRKKDDDEDEGQTE